MEGTGVPVRLSQVLAELKGGTKPSTETVRAIVSSPESSIKDSKESDWDTFLEVTRTCVELFPSDMNIWVELIIKLINEVNSLEAKLTPPQYLRCREVEALLVSLTDSDITSTIALSSKGPAPKRRKRNGEVDKMKTLSHYALIVELRPYFERDREAAVAPHWTLETFMNALHMRYQNLVDMLTVSGAAERCRLFSRLRTEELHVLNKIPAKHHMIDETAVPKPRTNFVYTLAHMICHRAPLEAFTQLLGPPPPQETVGSSQPPTPISSVLTEAAVYRVLQLLQSTAEQPPRDMPLNEFVEKWWGHWHCFAEQFYAFVEHRLIDFQQVMTLLSRSHSSPGKKTQDNVVVWLLTQCLPMEHIKKQFLADLTASNGRLFTKIMEFYNPEQAEKHPFELRDTSIHCLMFRIYNIVDPSASTKVDVNKLVPPSMLSFSEKGVKTVHAYRKWWNETEKNGENLDFFNLPPDKLWSVSLLSNFTSQPISTAVFDTLNRTTEPSPLVPGRLPYKGSKKPLPSMLLYLLSIRTRQRVLELIESQLFAARPPSQPGVAPFVNSPAIIDTYARLLYTAPYTKNRYRLLKNLMRGSEPQVLHPLLELLSYRLLRFFKYHNSMLHLFLSLHECAMSTTHHQLFHLLQNLLLKISHNFHEVMKFSKTNQEIDFGESLNRNLIISLAKTIKTKGIGSYTQVRDVTPLLTRFYTISPHQWSANTLKYFPDIIKDFYKQNLQPPQQVAKETVFMEVKLHEQSFPGVIVQYQGHHPNVNLEPYLTSIIDSYNAGTSNKKLFLCQVWLYCKQQANVHQYNTLRVLQSFTPQEVTRCHYVLIDFILDSFQQQMFNEFFKEPASTEEINQTGSLLSKLIWVHKVLSFEEILLALADRDDDINAFSLLEYLLLSSTDFTSRLEAFLSLHVREDHWNDPDYFSSNFAYHDRFPEMLPPFEGQNTLPVYYGNVCLSVLPILDVILGRLLENDSIEIVARVVQTFGPLYRYHDAPVSFLIRFLHYYYDNDAISSKTWKLIFVDLIKHTADSIFTPQFKQFLSSKNPSLVVSMPYYQALLNNVSNYINTDIHLQAKFHTTSPFQIFHEFPSTSEAAVHYTLLEILLLPLSASEIATKLLDIVQPVKETAALHVYNTDSLVYGSQGMNNDSNNSTNNNGVFMNMDGVTNTPPSSSQLVDVDMGQLLAETVIDISDEEDLSAMQLSLMDDIDRTGKEKEKEKESKEKSPLGRPTISNRTISSNVLFNFMGMGEDTSGGVGAEGENNNSSNNGSGGSMGSNGQTGGPPSFAQVIAVSLILASLPKQFHNPVYERAVLLLKQSPLLPCSDLIAEMSEGRVPFSGPFSNYAFSDYSANVESLLNNTTNRVLVLLQNFFYFGSIENFSIFCGFVRAMSVKSISQLFMLCKILAPFIYRLSTKPEIFGEIVLELLKCFENMDSHSLVSEVYAEVTPAQPLHYLDTTVDFLHHCLAIFKPDLETKANILKAINAMPPELARLFKSYR